MPSAGRLRPLGFWALAGVALLVSHDAIFLVQAGPGEELTRVLRSAGHDYWGPASAALAGLGLVAAVMATLYLGRLRQRARSLGARPAPRAGSVRRALRTWGALLTIVAVGFVVQESVEHLAAHGHAIGMGALLGPEYPLAVPVIAAITGFAALVATLVGGTERALLAGIEAAEAVRAARSPSVRGPAPAGASRPRGSILSRPGASRAPPLLAG